ncbi:thermonuclease family protein, partial [Kaistella sp.]|uniref:thermonuclease family protein n=1 Tax=Kaistella sp. TaxID=2782235 RepID=UPI003FA54702
MKKQLFILFLIISNFIISQTFTGKVVGVKDGDTMVVLFENKPITIRLEHIDCPEKNQPFGSRAKQFAS